MPPRFRTRAAVAPLAKDPERLYDDLPRRPGAPEALWAHQADVLRTYHSKHLKTPDIALELPTGAGRLCGAADRGVAAPLAAAPGAVACPTQQLARQTAEAASLVGIEARTLVGSHRDWSTADKIAYESGGTLRSSLTARCSTPAPRLSLRRRCCSTTRTPRSSTSRAASASTSTARGNPHSNSRYWTS